MGYWYFNLPGDLDIFVSQVLVRWCIAQMMMMMMMMMMNCFCRMIDRQKALMPYFQPGPLSEILTIANLWHAASRVWTCTESEFRLCLMKLCSSDNHYTTVPRSERLVVSSAALLCKTWNISTLSMLGYCNNSFFLRSSSLMHCLACSVH